MAQAEDTELRDLVIEALERNGSLAKIRALLRANIFLAFEDECANLKQNINLDNVLKLPEGILALSAVHEFLEFCCLKNTLFVYMSESRQGNEYNYEGKKSLADKFNIPKVDALNEPILLTLIKNLLKSHKKSFDPNNSNLKKQEKSDKNYIDEQNCTYILHEDSQSSNNSNSNSDNSSDEKNKLHLRLQLDNSDTDTSSDFARDKSSSEYIPGDHILESNNNKDNVSNFTSQKSNDCVDARSHNTTFAQERPERDISHLNNELKLTNSSSESTSYIELKPFNSLDEKMLNTAGLPVVEADVKSTVSTKVILETNIQGELPSPRSTTTLSSMSPKSSLRESENKVESIEKKSQESVKSDAEIGDLSYGDDFSSSPGHKLKDVPVQQIKSVDSVQDDLDKSPTKNSSIESPHQTSQSSQSSVSLSDVADLLSEKSSLSNPHNKSIHSPNNRSKDKVDVKSSKIYSDDSGDFTESPVPSLSNLSLDIHSD